MSVHEPRDSKCLHIIAGVGIHGPGGSDAYRTTCLQAQAQVSGRIHTTLPLARANRADDPSCSKQPLHVDLHALTLTLGWVTDVVITIVMEFPKAVLSTSKKAAVLKAFNKLIWLQQDLFQRHYVRTDEEAAANLAKVRDQARAGLLAEKLGEVRVSGKTLGEVREEEEAREAAEGLPEVEVK